MDKVNISIVSAEIALCSINFFNAGRSIVQGSPSWVTLIAFIGGAVCAICAARTIRIAREAERLKKEHYKLFEEWQTAILRERKRVADIHKACAAEKKRVRVIRLALYHKNPLVRKKNAKRILKEDKKNGSKKG